MTIPFEQLHQQFQDAVTDLWWTSETDAPFEVIVWPQAFEQGFSVPELLKLTGLETELPIQEIPFEQFFFPALQVQDWYGEEEKADVSRFQLLKALIESHLTEIKVFRMGEIQLDLFILGKTEGNDWIALATQAVET